MRRSLTLALTLGLCIACAADPPLASPCGHARVEVSLTTPGDRSELDLLLVLDGSPATSAWRPAAATELARLVRVFGSGDVDADGARDFTPAHLLHVAVIDTDMGTGAISGAPACDGGSGSDGRFHTLASGTGGCPSEFAASHPEGIFAFTAGRDDPDVLAADVACVLDAVERPCAYSRAGDAVLAALDAARQPGFLGAEAELGILVVTAQDDCSTLAPEILSSADPYGAVSPGLRCDSFADELRSIDELARQLMSLRPGHPERLHLGVAAGVPIALAGMDPATILADPAMDPRADPAAPERLAPACVRASDGALAFPASRWAHLAQALDAAGASSTLQSICNASLGGLGDTTTELLPERIWGLCLPRPIDADADGFVPCVLTMTLPAIGTTTEPEHCADLPRPEAFELDSVLRVVDPVDGSVREREVCRVRQVGRATAGIDAGWAYDDGSPDLPAGWSALPLGCQQRVGLSVIAPGHDVELRAICDERLLPGGTAVVVLGTPCDPATGTTTHSPIETCALGRVVTGDIRSAALACDAFDRSCQRACATDADCAQLPGFVCDLRVASDYFEGDVPTGLDPGAIRGFCFDPSCAR